MRTTVEIPEPMIESAKGEAQDQGVTFSLVIQYALTEHFARREAMAPRKFQLRTVRGTEPPAINLDRTSAVLMDLDAQQYGGQ